MGRRFNRDDLICHFAIVAGGAMMAANIVCTALYAKALYDMTPEQRQAMAAQQPFQPSIEVPPSFFQNYAPPPSFR